MTHTDVTATLENWYHDPVRNIVWGDIYGDIHHRWPDNVRIHTSNLHSVGPFKEGDVIETLNSTYKLGIPWE